MIRFTDMTARDKEALAKTFASKREAMRIFRVRHAAVQSMIARGDLQTVNIDGREMIVTASIIAYIDRQMAQVYADPQPAPEGKD